MKKKKQIESLYIKRKFLFTYNGVSNKESNLSHNIKKFQQDYFIIVKFIVYFINFKSKTNLKDIFNYNFCFWSIYLLKKGQIILTRNR